MDQQYNGDEDGECLQDQLHTGGFEQEHGRVLLGDGQMEGVVGYQCGRYDIQQPDHTLGLGHAMMGFFMV